MTGIELSDDLRERLRRARRAVVFTGAGVSRESGLATFRGAGGAGLWERFRPEELATPRAFAEHPDVVWRWYVWRFQTAAAARPNPAHHAVVKLAPLFPSFLVATQNVDGLHQRAGSADVVELHGSLLQARCHACGRRTKMDDAVRQSPESPPACPCGGLYRPAVVWFGEQLPAAALGRALEEAARCDLLIAAGTSATVFPAAHVIDVAHRGGAVIVEVNPAATAFSGVADLRLEAAAGEALPVLVEEVARCRRRA